jgi:hypothetical protein
MTFFTIADLQDGVLVDIVKSAPSAVSAVLVIVTVFAFLKYLRSVTKDFLERSATLSDRFADAIDANTKALGDLTASVARVLEAIRDRN